MTIKVSQNPYVLLINPPFQRLLYAERPYIPYGLLYIATFLQKNGIKSKVYNADLRTNNTVNQEGGRIWKEIEHVVKREKPDVVGIGVLTPQYASALKVASIVKNFDGDIPVIFGGVHSTFMADEVALGENVDIVVRGEGEETTLDIVKTLMTEESLKNVSGITYRKNKEIVRNPDRPLIKNLDILPFPDRELLINKRFYPHSEFGVITPSRGCPYRCTFCSSNAFWGYRTRSAENIVDEIEYLKDRYHLLDFWLEGDSFLIIRKHVLQLCKELKARKLRIMWGAMARVDQIDKELIKEMKSSGFCNISLGCESGSQKILDAINKGVTVEQIRNAVRLLKKEGIFVNTYWMVGYQEETVETIKETKNLMKELKPNLIRTFIMTPFPGSAEYRKAKAFGRLLSNDWSDYHVSNPHLLKRPYIDNKVIEQEYKEFLKMEERETSAWFLYLMSHPKLLLMKTFETLYQFRGDV
ncbi:MAG TPA: radical SAM protein [Thermoplasmatales archaeon]|nr:radical SAM protein [Thermoplasmatales archaeon]